MDIAAVIGSNNINVEVGTSAINVAATPSNIDVEVGTSNVSATVGGRSVNVTFPVGIHFSYSGWLDGLDEYSSDEDAIADGYTSGDWYRTTSTHVAIPGIVPTRLP